MARFITKCLHCPGKTVWKSDESSRPREVLLLQARMFPWCSVWLGGKFFRTIQFPLMCDVVNSLHKYLLGTKCVIDILLVPGNKEVSKTDTTSITMEL